MEGDSCISYLALASAMWARVLVLLSSLNMKGKAAATGLWRRRQREAGIEEAECIGRRRRY